MYNRSFKPPESAYFLFGPRGTGKSTWVRSHYPEAYLVDLLPSQVALFYQKDPGQIVNEILALRKERWVVLDEIQKVPRLLDDVHSLMENHGYRRFVLTGSSARKLKRGASNLLAGRAVVRRLLPLTSYETNFAIPVEQSINYGMLPYCVTLQSDEQREDFLTSYVETYVTEEVQHEGLVRRIGSFARFMDTAALAAGTQVNVSGLARDTGVGRDTVRGYFSIFEDTLLGSWLPAYRPRAKIKEVGRSKFYWFDSGVLNAASGAFRQPMPGDWQGILMENWLFHELTSYLEYARSKGTLGFWGTPSRAEIDFLWWYGNEIVAVEVKAAHDFRSAFTKGIKSFAQRKPLKAAFVVYRGEKELKTDGIWVLPVLSFLRKLHGGDILGH